MEAEVLIVDPEPRWSTQRPYARIGEAGGRPEAQRGERKVTLTEEELLGELLDVMMGMESSMVQVDALHRCEWLDNRRLPTSASVKDRSGEVVVLRASPAVAAEDVSVLPGDQQGMVARICGVDSAPSASQPSQEDWCAESVRKSIISWSEVWQLYRDLATCSASTWTAASDILRDAPSTHMAPAATAGVSMTGQALGYALRQFLEQHFVLAVQLEQQLRNERGKATQLTIQSLWFYLQPYLRAMHFLQRLNRDIRAAAALVPTPLGAPPALLPSGPTILNTLHRHHLCLSADTQSKELFQCLLENASVPYLRMLEQWIYTGELLEDPHDEFMIRKREAASPEADASGYVDADDRYGHMAAQMSVGEYVVVEENVLSFLAGEKELVQRIFATGKYMNLLRTFQATQKQGEEREEAAGGQAEATLVRKPFQYEVTSRLYVSQVNEAYGYASKRLLNILMQQESLLAKLRALKRFYLLDRCDYYTQFLEISQSELYKPADEMQIERLDSLLHFCVRTSGSADVPAGQLSSVGNSSDELEAGISIYVVILEHTLQDQASMLSDPTFVARGAQRITGEEAISLQWREGSADSFSQYRRGNSQQLGLSMVVRKRQTQQYQLLLRLRSLLLQAKIRMSHSRLRLHKLFAFGHEMRRILAPAHRVLHWMQHFVQVYQYHLSYEVISPNWAAMEEQLQEADTIEDLQRVHAHFLDKSIQQSLFSHQKVLKVITKLLSMCTLFATYVSRFIRPMSDGVAEEKATNKKLKMARPLYSKDVGADAADEVDEEAYRTTVSRFEANFQRLYRNLVATLHALPRDTLDHCLANLVIKLTALTEHMK